MKAEPRNSKCPRCEAVVIVRDTAGTICMSCGNEFVSYPKMTQVQENITNAVETVAAIALVVAVAFMVLVFWYAGLL